MSDVLGPTAAESGPTVDEQSFTEWRDAAQVAAQLLRAIGSPHRLMILCLLMRGEKTVNEISAGIGARQSLTSQHLTRLRHDKLVSVRRDGHFAYYSISSPVATEIISVLCDHYWLALENDDPPAPMS